MGYTLCVLGCGTMGIAIISGVLASLQLRLTTHEANGVPPTPGTSTPPTSYMITAAVEDNALPDKFIGCVSRKESAKRLKTLFSVHESVGIVSGENVKAARQADVVILCCKPQLASAILLEDGMREALEGKMLISILAGVTISQIKGWVSPETKVIRAMPNTPCKIREGMTVVTALPPSPSHALDTSILLSIFSSIGRCRFLDEKHFDACTALSGSGPAFACVVLEAMADGGVMMGLPRAEALELAAQTLQGTARMVLQTGQHPAQIKDTVTTPGGCTIAGLLSLEDGRVRSTIARAIQAATEHASMLGQEPTKK